MPSLACAFPEFVIQLKQVTTTKRQGDGLFDVRELNVAIEIWSVLFCIVGIVCTIFFSHIQLKYRYAFLAMFALELASVGGDALAGIYRGKQGSFAWTATHVGNHLTFLGGFLLVGVLTTYLVTRIHMDGGPQYRTWSRLIQLSSAVMCICAVLGVFFYIDSNNIYHRSEWYWLSNAFVVLLAAVDALLVLKNRKLYNASALFCMLFYTIAPIASAIAQTFIYGINFNAITSTIGLVLLFLEMQASSAAAFADQAEALARSEVELSDKRIAAMVSQIQPHFLFNTLDTIYGLCDEDVELAKKAIASFSRYLRTNLDSLRRTVPVPIMLEMEHVRTYLELERMSDKNRFHYTLDIQATDFQVPALSVQTIVENAVKHGLGGRAQGGTVVVRTQETDAAYLVVIEDDGVGFQTEGTTKDGTHVGIENSRMRLDAMCNGTLDISSELGKGTTATIRIPKRRTT